MKTATHTASQPFVFEARQAVPAYAALCVALGAAGYMLAYLLDTTVFSAAYGAAFALAVGSTFAANHGADDARFTAQLLRFVTVPALLGVTALTNGEKFFASYFSSTANELVAGWLGLIMVLCITSIGLNVEGRPVPIAMPLVPALSLFGLLNIIIVDTIVQISFAIFACAGLFLVGYERLLSTTLRRRLAGLEDGARQSAADDDLHRWSPRDLGRLGVAGGVWFALILVMAMIVFSPLYAVMPGILPSPISRLSQSTAQTDWRSSPHQMEVRGGTHVLSEREIFKVTVLSGQASGLWRGKVYQDYVASTWKDDVDFAIPLPREKRTHNGWTLMPTTEELPAPDASVGHIVKLQAQIEPLAFMGSPCPLIAPGRLLAMRANFKETMVSARTGAVMVPFTPLLYNNHSYDVAAMDVAPGHRAQQVPGLDEAQIKEWLHDSRRAPAIRLPSEEMARGPLVTIAQEIQKTYRAQGHPLNTPMEKAQAITAWLHANCAYSLNAPVSPGTADGVVWFLTKTHEGACDMFASSLALLLRAMDVPARLATGYQSEDAEIGHEITLREKDAHAWVEYWVPGLGWVSADPTAGARLAQDSVWLRLSTGFKALLARTGGGAIALPVLGALLLLAGALWPQLEKLLGRQPETATGDELRREEILRAYQQATRLIRRHAGASRARGIAPFTPRELDDAISIADLPDAARQEFAALTLLHQSARYGNVLPAVGAAELKASVERLKRALRTPSS